MKISALHLHHRKCPQLHLITLTFALLIGISLCSCSPSNRIFKNSNKWLPADFDPATTVLLIQNDGFARKEEQKMQNYMPGHYPYKYKFIPLDTIKSAEGKYADIRRYKYALVASSHVYMTPNGNQPRWFGMMVFDFNFYNRVQNKNYPSTKKPSSYSSWTFKVIINTIVKKFR